MPPPPPMPVEGWKADPSVPSCYRYWDETGWTDDAFPSMRPVRPVASAASRGAFTGDRRTMLDGVTVVLTIMALPVLAALFALAPSLRVVFLILLGGFIAATVLGLTVRLINWISRNSTRQQTRTRRQRRRPCILKTKRSKPSR